MNLILKIVSLLEFIVTAESSKASAEMCKSQFMLILFTTCISFRPVRSSVSLTVEGEASLVGPHCPGTVKLFCEGVDLTLLRWRYNGSINIEPLFGPEDSVTIHTVSSPAFLFIELTAVSTIDSVFANFSSILTVDLTQLEQQNIRNISCGDTLIRDGVPVKVSITQETVPEDPLLIHANTSVVYGIRVDGVYTMFSLLWKEVQLYDFQLFIT